MSELISNSILRSPLHCLHKSSLQVVFLPGPKLPKAMATKTNMLYQTKGVSTANKKAAFFDVDGTITKTNVVVAYGSYRVQEIPMVLRLLWLPWFALSCLAFFLVDRIDRTAFNHLFYLASFKNRSIHDKKSMARTLYQDYYQPRLLRDAKEKIQILRNQGYHIVLVTGSPDFMIEPLACELGAHFVYATELVEKEGKFTGQARGAGASSSSKAQCVVQYANKHQISLSKSLAFGDSIADLCMLEAVGMPHAVNPDKRLKSVAESRGWPIIYWQVKEGKVSFDMDCSSSNISKNQSYKTREVTYI